jgi:hypothetical protein
MQNQDSQSKQNSGTVAVWLTIGVAMGVAIGTAMGQPAIGVGIGLALGVALNAIRRQPEPPHRSPESSSDRPPETNS